MKPAVRLVCRLYGDSGGWGTLASALAEKGWSIEGKSAAGMGLTLELFSESGDGSEVVLNLKGDVGGGEVAEVLQHLIPPCWYVDVYYHFRGGDAREAAARLGLPLEGNERRRLRIKGVNVVVESYPSASSLTLSYRIAMGEARGAQKIHSFITGGKRGLLGRLVGRG